MNYNKKQHNWQKLKIKIILLNSLNVLKISSPLAKTYLIDSEDYPFNEANFQSDAFQIDTLTDILEYFKDSFVENMKDKIIAFKDKFLNLIPNLKKNFLANLEDL